MALGSMLKPLGAQLGQLHVLGPTGIRDGGAAGSEAKRPREMCAPRFGKTRDPGSAVCP